MTIALGSDHVGYLLKQAIRQHLEARGEVCRDYGCDSPERAEYPIYGERVGRAVAAGECELGILICGTGAGISLAANQVPGIRAVVCSEPYTAQLSRRHNDSNILAFGARVVGEELAKMIVDAWLDAHFEGGRHQTRVDMIAQIRNRNV